MKETGVLARLKDVLTPFCAEILQANAQEAYRALVVEGANHSRNTEALERVTPAQLLAQPIRSNSDAEGVLAGLWLWQDELDRSHTISQSITSESGSYWHAIMHRREGDFSNAKYWYARCRHHPVRADLPVYIESMLATDSGCRDAERLIRSGWDAEGFVDLVEEVHHKPSDPRHGLAVRLQRMEWEMLFAHCAMAAVGRE